MMRDRELELALRNVLERTELTPLTRLVWVYLFAVGAVIGPTGIEDIRRGLGCSAALVGRALRRLREAGLVKTDPSAAGSAETIWRPVVRQAGNGRTRQRGTERRRPAGKRGMNAERFPRGSRQGYGDCHAES